MSSRLGDATRGGSLGVDEQGSIDDVGQAALEGAQCFGLRVPGGDPALDVGLGVIVAAHLRDGDAVDGGVELAVAGA